MSINYSQIDYEKWNLNGKGENIKEFLNEKEKRLWNNNLQYIDKRGDLGHIEVVTYFTLKFLDMFPRANRNVVIPATIMHDNGWSQMNETELKLFYLTEKDGKGVELWRRYEGVLRDRHQELGEVLGMELLTEQGCWDGKDILEVGYEISQHDTVPAFVNVEDGILKNADKIYRFTYPHLGQAIRNRDWNVDDVNGLMKKWMHEPGYFLDSKMIEVAETERKNTLAWNEKHPVLENPAYVNEICFKS